MSMMRVAALMVALVMVLGFAQVLRPCVAAANEDVELLQPPSPKGDPDSGGGNYVRRFGLRLVFGLTRGYFLDAGVLLVRRSTSSHQPLVASRRVRSAVR